MIIAVDFDGALAENAYPDIGEPINPVIAFVKWKQAKCAKVILWTCRKGKELEAALLWCEVRGIRFDAVNENLPEVIEKFGGDTRKIYADLYIDDRAINPWETPRRAIKLNAQ
ncbi:hypothetical protein FACS1894216_00990 [Synergistales bacterium]|nr:hypothetical protein FACS1894216_00990 [Synergistales bacterium]